MNATFGNATELIIAIIALKTGLVDVVKATITGSIISNLLLVVGFAMLLGGLSYKEQEFQPIVARVNASAMNLALSAILLPTAVKFISNIQDIQLQHLSIAVAVVLILVYGLMLVFSMRTHTYLYEVGLAEIELVKVENALRNPDESPHKVNLWFWNCVLLVTYVAEINYAFPKTPK